jgi:tripartite-type tricarboxylate transporter receptor subunit TctC
MKNSVTLGLVCLFLCSLFFDARPAVAAPYYQGKVITIIVGYGPGGGYDRIARIIQPFWSRTCRAPTV